MKVLICILFGYLLGSLNPAALISRIKRKNLRKIGTGNLGATNVLLNFGKGFGAIVLVFDMAKAFAAYELAELIFPNIALAGMVAGVFAVIGHIFPFYLKFKGGRGLAAYGGLVLAYNPWLFLFLLISGFVLMFIVNYSFILPFYAAAFFSLFAVIRDENLFVALLAVAVSALIFATHFGNFVKAIRGEERKIRDFLKRGKK
ncbi:MAG: glycerol-3-phosphate acyltransferase [Clostridia bacterium]|nr:glycerol-3-phosphate acyltransferase [Clostridia bacterium]